MAGVICDWAQGSQSQSREYTRSASPPHRREEVPSVAAQAIIPPRGPLSHSMNGRDDVPRELSNTYVDADTLVDQYFATVHHFAFNAFIHEGRFKAMLRSGKAPKELTMAIAASVLRFASEPTSANLDRSDKIVDMLVRALVPRVLQGFGVIQLMTLLLVYNCEIHRNNFTSAWMISGLLARMMQLMSLQVIDRTSSEDLPCTDQCQLLTREALRRVAWAVYYSDSIMDGGNYGFQVVDVNGYRIQLPCKEKAFLANEAVETEPLYRPLGKGSCAALGISAYLMRAANLRRRALHFAYRVSWHEAPFANLQLEGDEIEQEVNAFNASIPERYQFSAENTYTQRSRLPAYTVLQLLRHNLYIILGRGRILLFQMDDEFARLVPVIRRERINRALPIAAIIEEALKYNMPMDPHVAVQAYVALEILLFETRRLAAVDPAIVPTSPRFVDAITPLVTAIREIGRRSDMVKLLHVEAVHRMLSCELMSLLTSYDLEVFGDNSRPVNGADSEFNFRDFRFAKVERSRRLPSSRDRSGDGDLLNYPESVPSGARGTHDRTARSDTLPRPASPAAFSGPSPRLGTSSGPSPVPGAGLRQGLGHPPGPVTGSAPGTYTHTPSHSHTPSLPQTPSHALTDTPSHSHWGVIPSEFVPPPPPTLPYGVNLAAGSIFTGNGAGTALASDFSWLLGAGDVGLQGGY